MEDFERLTKDAAYVETAEAVGKAINERLLKLQETLSAQEEAARASAERAAEANFRLERASKELDDLEVKKSSLEEEILERRRELATLEGTLSQKRDELENSQESEEDASE
jgi:chromosome segregation ATPase